MPTLLQIDSCLGVGSTGRITESIGSLVKKRGWDCYVAHGSRYVGHSELKSIPVVNKFGEYRHALRSMLFDDHGLASVRETKKFIEKIKSIKPDIIQLHCVHGYYLNYQLLFEYLNEIDTPVVWTFHDCWAFTGHCAHFDAIECSRWYEGECGNCPILGDYPCSILDRSNRNYVLKRNLFTRKENLHIVAVSQWLSSLVKRSFFKDKDLRVINNGVDLQAFRPFDYNRQTKPYILGVASSWNRNKGLYDFYKIRQKLPIEIYDVVLVGLSDKQIKNLPAGIKGLTRTESLEELAKLYSGALALVNPTYSDSFPTVNMEALACGTPVITYRTGGSPEIIDEKTGYVVDCGDVDGIISAITMLKNNPLSSNACRDRALKLFNKEERFMDYICLYEDLLKEKI